MDCAILPKERPNPIFPADEERMPESWFELNEEQSESRLKEMTCCWYVNMAKVNIAARKAFIETITYNNHPVTIPGMLPFFKLQQMRQHNCISN